MSFCAGWVIALSTTICHQSSVIARRGTKVGWNTPPTVQVLAFSTSRLGLPEVVTLIWPDDGVGIEPELPPGAPGAAQSARDAGGAAPWQGSTVRFESPWTGDWNSSWMLGERTPPWYMPLRRMPTIGSIVPPAFHVVLLPVVE